MAPDRLFRVRTVGMKVGGTMVAFYYGDCSSALQDPSKALQRFQRIRKMFQDETQEHMVEAAILKGQMEYIGKLKRNIRKTFRGDALSCSAKGFFR